MPLSSTNLINIRRAVPADAAQIATLFMRTWRITLKDVIPEGFLDRFSFEAQKQKYIERAADPTWNLWIAIEKQQHQLIGMVGSAENHSPPLAYPVQVRGMYVDPAFQRQGIGSMLFNRLLQSLREQDCPNLMLWCIKANIAACAFYEKHGGKKIENIQPPEEYSTMPHVIYVWQIRSTEASSPGRPDEISLFHRKC